MRPTTTTTTTVDIIKTPKFVKFTAFTLLSLSLLLLLFNHFSPSTEISAPTPSLSPPHQNSLPPPPAPENPVVERMGIVDENGAMAEDFKIGDFDVDSSLVEETQNLSDGGEESGVSVSVSGRVKIDKFRVCDEIMRDYIPCFDNVEEIKRWNWSERHCRGEGKGLDCLVPMPKGYKRTIPWPQSRDEVWFSNLPHTRPVEVEGGKNLIAIKNDKFIFPSGGTQIFSGENQYLNQISQMVPDIAFGHRTRVALDIGCGVASFGAFLMQLNVTTLSIAPKDVHENQIQFALERGVPAMIAVFARHRFLYPSQAFDLIHCSRCGINWTRDDGILLLEANRLLRAGGYFVWAYQPVNKHKENVQEQWKDMKDLTTRICWELVNREGSITVWRKPLNNSCYLNRDTGVKPPICDSNDDADKVWYIGLRACITRLPENGYGANVTRWPTRLHYPPDRLQSIKLDAYISRKEIFNAESKYWNKIIDSYVGAFHWKEYKLRNVMDMRAGFGGFAAALHDFQIDCWVMNVVPVSGFNTLPIIYDRGLIGVIHDWCEPFDTYPRTYDLLHAAGLFSVEQKRCNISTIMLEMDRMLRPGGRVYIRESVSVISEIQELATAMGWTPALHDTSEGPHSSLRILICEKRM